MFYPDEPISDPRRELIRQFDNALLQKDFLLRLSEQAQDMYLFNTAGKATKGEQVRIPIFDHMHYNGTLNEESKDAIEQAFQAFKDVISAEILKAHQTACEEVDKFVITRKD